MGQSDPFKQTNKSQKSKYKTRYYNGNRKKNYRDEEKEPEAPREKKERMRVQIGVPDKEKKVAV